MRRKWNPDEDMELPIWHPAHVMHMRHLEFSAQVVNHRCSIEEVEDFLVGVTEITPLWADRMLRPLVESASRRKVVQRSLANKTKKNLSDYEWELLLWSVDADTDSNGAVEHVMEVRDDVPHAAMISRAGEFVVSPLALHEASVSPYIKFVWGLTEEDADSIVRNPRLIVDVPITQARDLVQVCFREPLHSFFTRSSFVSERPSSSTRIFSWGKMAALWGYPRPQNENVPSEPFIRTWRPGFIDIRPIVENMYRFAREELARATAVVSLHYALEYAPGGAIPREQRLAAGEHRQRRHEKPRSRKHSGWLGGGYRDTPIDVIAAFYADVFGVT